MRATNRGKATGGASDARKRCLIGRGFPAAPEGVRSAGRLQKKRKGGKGRFHGSSHIHSYTHAFTPGVFIVHVGKVGRD